MSGAKYQVSLCFVSLIVCGFAQYLPYPYNYGYYPYPVSNQGYIYQQSPCQSSCGNVQPTSNCQQLPCYSQQYPYYMPYAYNNNYNTRNINTGRFVNSNRLPVSQNQASTPDPYANVPVEIIDVGSVSSQPVKTPANKNDPFANVPVQFIDDNGGSSNFWQNLPYLPKSKKSPSTNYTVNQGVVSSNTVTENKPIQATITRTFQPAKQAAPIRLDFLNGVPINGNDNEANQNFLNDDDKAATAPPETTTIITTEESEDVSAVKSWF
jgi:hypothetical protein